MTDKNFTTYTFTQKMGMEGIGDMAWEWMTQEEIEKHIVQDKIRVQKLKDAGLYGKEYTTTIEIEHDPILDGELSTPEEIINPPQKDKTIIHNYSFIIWDASKE